MIVLQLASQLSPSKQSVRFRVGMMNHSAIILTMVVCLMGIGLQVNLVNQNLVQVTSYLLRDITIAIVDAQCRTLPF